MQCQHWYHMTQKVVLHLDLTNKMVSLTMPSEHVMLKLVPTALHNQKSHVTPCFNFLYIMNKKCAVDAFRVTLQQFLFQLHHMTEKVMVHLILIIVT